MPQIFPMMQSGIRLVLHPARRLLSFSSKVYKGLYQIQNDMPSIRMLSRINPLGKGVFDCRIDFRDGYSLLRLFFIDI